MTAMMVIYMVMAVMMVILMAMMAMAMVMAMTVAMAMTVVMSQPRRPELQPLYIHPPLPARPRTTHLTACCHQENKTAPVLVYV